MYYENMEFKKINDLQAEQTALKQLTIKINMVGHLIVRLNKFGY